MVQTPKQIIMYAPHISMVVSVLTVSDTQRTVLCILPHRCLPVQIIVHRRRGNVDNIVASFCQMKETRVRPSLITIDLDLERMKTDNDLLS